MRPEALVGRTIAGKYHIEALIGRGGFGAVYRAVHHAIGRTVALKISLHALRPELHARFVREARVQARLRHPTCVTLLDFGQEPDGLFYMVQEFVDGQTLAQIIKTRGPFAPARALAITRQVLLALHEAHRLGIVHRDIKPANVMLTLGEDGEEEVRLLDFGIAKALDEGAEHGLTRTGTPLGTPAFMAPEQIRQGEITAATDVYAAGAMLYRICAGFGPFEAEAQLDVMLMHLNAPPPTLPFEAPALDALIATALSKDPKARHASARAMIEAIDALDGLEGIGAITMSDPTLPARHGDRVMTRSAPNEGSITITRGEIEDARSAPPSPAPRGRVYATLAAIAAIGVAVLIARTLDDSTTLDETDLSWPAALHDATAPDETDPSWPGARDASPRPATLTPPPLPDAAIADVSPPERDATPPRAMPSPDAGRPPPPDAAPPSPPDASRRPPPDASRPPTAAELARAIQRHIKACRCDRVPTLLDRLQDLDRALAAPVTRQFQEECRALLPGNCTDKAGR